MNAVEKAKKETQKREEALAKFTDEKIKLGQAIESLKTERSAAVRALASGDASQRKRILKLESDIKDRGDVLEGLTQHITEAENALQQATAALKEAQAEQERRFMDFLNEANAKDAKKLSQDLETHYQAALLAKKTLAKEMGELSILWATYENRRDPGENIIFNYLLGLPDKLRMEDEKAGFVSADIRGFGGSIAVVPGIYSSELPADFKGTPRSVRHHAQYREAKRREELEREFFTKE